MQGGHEVLVTSLVQDGYLKSELLIEAFRAVDRKHFVPRDLEKSAYLNEPLPIGFGQTISQPLTVALMLEWLAPRPGERVLDAGAGSGWQAALIGYVVSRKHTQGKVIGIEFVRELAAIAVKNLKNFPQLKDVVEIICGDATDVELLSKHGGNGGFDKIVAAASGETIPQIWKVVLKIGGRIVVPVGDSIMVLDKISDSEFKTQEYPGFRFVPLVRD